MVYPLLHSGLMNAWHTLKNASQSSNEGKLRNVCSPASTFRPLAIEALSFQIRDQHK